MDVVPSRLKRFIAQTLIALLVGAQIVVLFPVHAMAQTASHLVISQIKTGGVDTDDEFIELYNPTNAPVSLDDWSVQYRGGAAATFKKQEFTGVKSVPAKGYFLLANFSGIYATGDDQTYTDSTISLSGVGGTVFLVSNDTLLTTGNEASIVDKVAYGTGTLFAETGPAVAPSTSSSIVRLPNSTNGNGTDTDNNTADFTTLTPANPRTSDSNPLPLPAPVLTLDATDDSITAEWPRVTSADSYGINYVPATTCSVTFPNADTSVSTAGGAQLNYTIDNLAPATSYAVRLTAVRGSDTASDCAVIATDAAVVDPDVTVTSITYTQSGIAKTVLGAGGAYVDVAVDGLVMSNEKPLTMTFQRPGVAPVNLVLTFNPTTDTWQGFYSVFAAQAGGAQDGVVTVRVKNALNQVLPITSGASFTVDTQIAAPSLSATVVCGPQVKTFRVMTDADVAQVNIYSTGTFDPLDFTKNRIMTVTPVAGVGNLLVTPGFPATAWMLAIDNAGNVSPLVTIQNDMTAPAMPHISVASGDRSLTMSWAAVAEAKEYTVRWKKKTDTTWNQASTTATSYVATVENGITYDVAVASVDSACNQSSFNGASGAAHATTTLSSVNVGSYESNIFETALTIGMDKDAPLNPPTSPYSLEEDKDQNGIKDAEEDKNNNGIKDGEETNQPGDDDDQSQVQDRSRLVAIIAVILIVAGAALAAYSWYKGEEAGNDAAAAAAGKKNGSRTKDPEPEPTETTEAAAPAEDKPAKEKKTPKGGKRKTRW